MRNGARPRRKPPVAPPGLSQSPEVRSPEDEFAAQGGEEVVELLVRAPIEALRGEPPEPPDAAPEAESVETPDVAAMSEAVDSVTASEPPQADAAVGPGFEPVRAAAPAVADPAMEIRFARLHLRTGSLYQARSEYESLAGNNLLDMPATLGLAEVRWRTGDLPGAGSAAAAYLAAAGQGALGFLIAAEAAAAQDHVADASRHAGRALERSVANLEVLFAGVPRRMTWPESAWTAPAAMKIDASSPAATPDRAATSPGMSEPPTEAPEGSLWARTEELPALEPRTQLPAPEPHLWDGEVAAGTAALRAGDALMAALHFAVALRMTPESARAVVDGMGERRDLALELVRGDALRLLGNGSDAGDAYASVASVLGKPRAVAQAPAPEPAAPQPAAQAPAVQQAPAPEPAAPASKVASTPEPAKKPEVDEPPAIRWE